MRTKTLLVLGVPLLWLATLASSVAVIYMRHRASELSFQLSQEQARHARLQRAWAELQIEKDRQTPGRVSASAAPAGPSAGSSSFRESPQEGIKEGNKEGSEP